jgi:hypothetical protein
MKEFKDIYNKFTMYDPQFAFEDACLNNDVVLVNHLLDTVAIEIKDAIISYVCRYGCLDVLKILINRTVESSCVFYLSCKYNQIHIVNYLLSNSNSDITNVHYINSLSISVSSGHTEIVERLIKDPKMKINLAQIYDLLVGSVEKIDIFLLLIKDENTRNLPPDFYTDIIVSLYYPYLSSYRNDPIYANRYLPPIIELLQFQNARKIRRLGGVYELISKNMAYLFLSLKSELPKDLCYEILQYLHVPYNTKEILILLD